MMPHADECIAKVTNFVTTLACYLDPARNAYAVEVHTLHRIEFTPRKARKTDLTPAEAITWFNQNAKEYGFKKRITIDNFPR
jgi:hypothetical protein